MLIKYNKDTRVQYIGSTDNEDEMAFIDSYLEKEKVYKLDYIEFKHGQKGLYLKGKKGVKFNPDIFKIYKQ